MAMDLTGLGAYTDYMTDVNRVNTENLQKKLENTANTAQVEETENEALLDACKQFEAYLWEQIYKEMDKSTKIFSDDEDEDGYASNMVDYFSETVVQQISSQTAAEQSNSLAHMLYEQAKRNYNM
ncbi:MAG: rod-binding protein [Lachnospiraceae bacterium]|mgnify:CR=1 FL=1|nr:rod-binding protein [Lachnospiraceae bacterium]